MSKTKALAKWLRYVEDVNGWPFIRGSEAADHIEAQQATIDELYEALERASKELDQMLRDFRCEMWPRAAEHMDKTVEMSNTALAKARGEVTPVHLEDGDVS